MCSENKGADKPDLCLYFRLNEKSRFAHDAAHLNSANSFVQKS